MYALLAKGNDKVRIETSGSKVRTSYDTAGSGFGLPFLDTVDDPQASAQEKIDTFVGFGWMLVEKEA